MYKILIVEDELIAAEYLKSILESRGWEVVGIVDNAVDAIKNIKKTKPNLVLIDIMINGPKSGCELAFDIKKISDCALVFTTAYADEEMINYAIEVAADGYIVKPYNEKEIIATVSLLSVKKEQNKEYKITKLKGGLHFNHHEQLLYKNEYIVQLGPKALKLIQTLCHHRDSIVSYKDLYEAIWNDSKVDLKKLQMVIYRIRNICQSNFLENINGVGYKIIVDHSFEV